MVQGATTTLSWLLCSSGGERGAVRKRPHQGKRVSKQGLTQLGGTIIHRVGSRAEPKRLNARSTGKACWHLGSGKQEETRGSRGRIRDHRMGPASIWAESNRPEPTGFESSVANLLPLPTTHFYALSEEASGLRTSPSVETHLMVDCRLPSTSSGGVTLELPALYICHNQGTAKVDHTWIPKVPLLGLSTHLQRTHRHPV